MDELLESRSLAQEQADDITERAADGEEFDPDLLRAAIAKSLAYHQLAARPVTVQAYDVYFPGACECGKPRARCDVVEALFELKRQGRFPAPEA